MSESNGEGHRTRRRAVRSAGPPVEENEIPTDAAPAPSSDAASATHAAPATGSDAATASDAAPANHAARDAKTPVAAGVKTTAATDAETVVAAAAETTAADDAKATPAKVSSGRSAETADADAEPSTVGAESSPPVPATDDSTADADKATVSMTKAAADSPSEQKPAPSKSRGLPRLLATAAAALLVVALVCGATLSVLAMRSAHERDERRAEYVETARQAIVNLTTIRADSAKQDIDRILSLASGEFKTEFDGRVDPFTSIVQQAKVVSSGEIVEAALESDDDRSGRVLVAAKQTLTNAGQAEPQTRYYRFRVTVSRGDSGLTVSNVEFVA
jgi:Mce-associated membrane protein